MQSPPFPRYLVPPRSKYSPEHHVLFSNTLSFISSRNVNDQLSNSSTNNRSRIRNLRNRWLDEKRHTTINIKHIDNSIRKQLGMCFGSIARTEKSYRLWCVWLWWWLLSNEPGNHQGPLPHKINIHEQLCVASILLTSYENPYSVSV